MSAEDKKKEATTTDEKPDPKLASIKSYWYPERAGNLEEVKVGYQLWQSQKRLIFLWLLPVAIALLISLMFGMRHSEEFLEVVGMVQVEWQTRTSHQEIYLYLIGVTAAFVFLLFLVFFNVFARERGVYLIDFSTYDAPEELKAPFEIFMRQTKSVKNFTEEDIAFQERLQKRSGLGNETYFPPSLMAIEPTITMEAARQETYMVLGFCLDELFAKTGLKPKDIDILIVNCSLFNPTPSMAAMMINKYKMRSDVRNYNLSGMGCSAGVFSVDLARDLLQVHKNCNAVILSTENITQNWYHGHDKSCLVSNTLFRVGGAAILVSNKWWARWSGKYRLVTTVRVHKGANDDAYNAVFQKEDAQGHRGISLSKDLLKVAGDALKTNLTILGPSVLPWSEQIKFFINFLIRKWEASSGSKKTPAYVPDFKKAFQHFCIHAGGRAIIDGMQENLKLEEHLVEPSRATLYRYGNTSSSSIWYELQFIERSGRMKKGDKVFQIALGSGFKCNSAVWRCTRNIYKS